MIRNLRNMCFCNIIAIIIFIYYITYSQFELAWNLSFCILLLKRINNNL